MKWKEFKIAAVVFVLPLLILWGCQGNKLVSPTRVTNLSVTVPISSANHASLLNDSNTEILYTVTAPGMAPVTGLYGPFSLPGNGGSVVFTIDGVTTGPGVVLALELIDTTSNQALAVGASSLVAGTGLVTVELGTIFGNCYVVSAPLASCDPTGPFEGYQGSYDQEFNLNTYGFDYDNFGEGNDPYESNTYTGSIDVDLSDMGFVANNTCNGYDIVDGWDGFHNSIAYMGNGNLVNFAYVPPDADFFEDGATGKANLTLPDVFVEVGDVYCVKLSGGTMPGHAWVQITNAGDYSNGPTFCYRVNTSTPYFAYQTSGADESALKFNDCSMVPDWINTTTGLPSAK